MLPKASDDVVLTCDVPVGPNGEEQPVTFTMNMSKDSAELVATEMMEHFALSRLDGGAELHALIASRVVGARSAAIAARAPAAAASALLHPHSAEGSSGSSPAECSVRRFETSSRFRGIRPSGSRQQLLKGGAPLAH